MIILDGKKLSIKIKQNLKNKISILKNKINRQPGLAIILVGNRPDSKVYVRMKKRACSEVGIINFDVVFPEDVSQVQLEDEIKKMNKNPNIDAILVQLPLPSHINTQKVLSEVSIYKDVDGFHTENVGKLTLNSNNSIWNAPCTPCGCIELLEHYNISLEGKNVVIIGRSNIVGLPLSLLLLHRNATVTVCHSKTKNLYDYTQMADILIVACGSPKLINKNHIKKNVVILDIGINKVRANNKKGYKLVGDVDYDNVLDKVEAITPVPGGIGPMTIAMLLKKTVLFASGL